MRYIADKEKSLGFRKTALDRLAPWPFRRYPYAFWFSLFLASLTVTLLFAWGMPNPRAYAGFCICQSIGFLTVPIVFRFANSLLLEWGRNGRSFVVDNLENKSMDFETWIGAELEYFQGTQTMYISAILFAMAATLIFSYSAPSVAGFRNAASVFGSLLIAGSGFIAGMGLFAVFCSCRLIWRIGRFRIRVTASRFGVLSTGRVLGQGYFATAIAWSYYVCSAIISAEHIGSSLSESRLPLLLLAAPTLMILLSSFFACQFPLHHRMIDFKRIELERVEGILDRLKREYSDDISKDSREKISFFEAQRNEIAALPEWPFTYSAILGAVGSTITIIVPALISTFIPLAAKAMVFVH